MTPQPIKQKDAFAISAYVIDKKPKEVSDLIRRNGIMLKSFASKKDIDKGFSTLLVTSAPFRKDFATLTANVVKNDKSAQGFFSADGAADTNNAQKQAWYETDLFKNAFKTVLDTTSTVITNNSAAKLAKANTNSQTAAQTAQSQLENSRQQPNIIVNSGSDGKGLGTGAIIGIVAGGLGLVGVIIYFATRKK